MLFIASVFAVSLYLVLLSIIEYSSRRHRLPTINPTDNLAANYSRELADYIIYVIDVAGGDKIPRKGGPGITQSDLLVINKTDLAEAVGADLEVSIISRLYPITK